MRFTQQTRILILGDSPSLNGGLSRIGRDIANGLSQMSGVCVGYMGRGGIASSNFPYPQYTFLSNEESQWGEVFLPEVAKDFFGTGGGVIFTVWDPYRLDWFGNPQPQMQRFAPDLYQTVTNKKIRKWGYFPIDSVGPKGYLTQRAAKTITGYERVLAYTPFGAEVIRDSIGAEVFWAPHFLDVATFQRTRKRPKLGTDQPILGCMMTNQPRKDWGVWAETAAQMQWLDPSWGFTIRVDDPELNWSIRGLVEDFGIRNVEMISGGTAPDGDLAHWYSGLTALFLPSHEGFGYPIAEALSCGTPVFFGSYGGGSYFTECLEMSGVSGTFYSFDPIAHRLDTRWNIYRPVFRGSEIGEKIVKWHDEGGEPYPNRLRKSVLHLNPDLLWPRVWERIVRSWL